MTHRDPNQLFSTTRARCVPTTWRQTSRQTKALALSLIACALSTGCPSDRAATTTTEPKPGATSAASSTGAPKGPDPLTAPADDATYVADGPQIPSRVGVTRRFLRQKSTNFVRDPAFLPSGDVVVAARIGAVLGLWRMSLDDVEPATLVVAKPLYDAKRPVSAGNRQNWYVGTPRVSKDGKYVVFDGTRQAASEKWSSVIGLASLETGVVEPLEILGTTTARTPDLHPDGVTLIVASCTELRVATLKGFGAQSLETRVLVELPRQAGGLAGQTVCTVHRPRFSVDGKRIVFEGIGQFVSDAFRAEYGVPNAANPGDYVIEPWIVNADGTGLRRLLTDDAYRAIGGRVQIGGSKEPSFSPDGQSIVFAHGVGVAVADAEGKSARMVVAGSGEAHEKVKLIESDPVYSPDGKKIVAASMIQAGEERTRLAPPGIAVIDLAVLDAAENK